MPNISGAESARKPPRVMAYAYGFSDRTHGEMYRRIDGEQSFEGSVHYALSALVLTPNDSLPYVVLRLDDGVELWVRRLREVVINPNIAQVAADAAAWEKETEIPF